MAPVLTTSEKILDQLANGSSFSDLSNKHGYTRKDLVVAALFGVSELHSEYIELLKKHGRFNEFTGNK